MVSELLYHRFGNFHPLGEAGAEPAPGQEACTVLMPSPVSSLMGGQSTVGLVSVRDGHQEPLAAGGSRRSLKVSGQLGKAPSRAQLS